MENGIREHKVGDLFSGFLLVKDMRSSVTRNGKPYLSVTLGDSTGDVGAMVWDATEKNKRDFTTGNVVEVRGNVTEYQGKKQINLQAYFEVTNKEEVDVSKLLETAPIKGKDLYNAIYDEVLNMENFKLKVITLKVLEKYKDDFELFPAAKSVHHSYVSGLAYHTYSMMNIAKGMCDLYPVLNRDLLLSGVILHDIGKIKEYSGCVATDVTLEGKLKGHISIMAEEIGNIARSLDIEGEEVLLLQHMILSHHGKGEWGSPVAPLVIEANVLHQIDMMDAGLDAFKKAVKETEKGEFTEPIFGLGNCKFYNHNL